VKFSVESYSTRDLAAFGGFRWVLYAKGSELAETEFSFLVILAKSKPVQYKYSEAEKGSGVRSSVTTSKNLQIRAFCHTHPKSDTIGRFGNDDKENFRETIKIPELAGIASYLMNHFQEVRIARGLEDFPEGKPTTFKPYRG
jgi:hypothetical protein